MEWFRNIFYKHKFSKKGEELTKYELSYTKFNKCPHCKTKTLYLSKSVDSSIVKSKYYSCYLCGFTHTIGHVQILKYCKIYLNIGFNPIYIKHNKSRLLKIKKIIKNSKK